MSLKDLLKDQRLAKEGHPIHCYEPEPGHIKIFREFNAFDNGPPTFVDLREIEILE